MKKRILTVLIAIITVIPLVLITPKADVQTSTHTVTSYGDYTFQQGMSTTTFNYELPGLPINLTWNSGSYMKLDYNFKDKYSGSMKLTVTSNQDWVLNSSPVYWSVSGDGVEAVCYISSTTTMSVTGKTKTFSIIFYNCTGIHFNVATGSSATFFTSSNSITISNATFTTQADLNDIYLDIRNFHNSWDLYIPDMSTNLSNIASNTSTIASDIAIIKGYLDGLEGYADNIEPLLDSIYNQVVDIHNIIPLGIDLMSVPAYIQFLNTGQSITNNNTVLPYSYFTFTGGTSYTLRFNLNQNESKYISFITGLSTPTWTLPENITMQTVKYTGISPLYALVTLKFTNSGTYGWFDFVFTYTYTRNLVPIYFGDGVGLDTDIAGFIGIDSHNIITSRLDTIINGINAINDPYDTSQYDQYEQTMDGLNDSLRDRFNNVDDNMQTNIDTLFTPSGTAGSDGSIFEKFNFNGVNSLFTGILNGIFTSFPAFRYILLFALLLLVIGVMI